jgi:hypothetical protein
MTFVKDKDHIPAKCFVFLAPKDVKLRGTTSGQGQLLVMVRQMVAAILSPHL